MNNEEQTTSFELGTEEKRALLLYWTREAYKALGQIKYHYAPEHIHQYFDEALLQLECAAEYLP